MVAIHESKNSEKVVKFLNDEQPTDLHDQLLKYTTSKYANRIIKAIKNNYLQGLYFTKSGNLRATFI